MFCGVNLFLFTSIVLLFLLLRRISPFESFGDFLPLLVVRSAKNITSSCYFFTPIFRGNVLQTRVKRTLFLVSLSSRDVIKK
jgi:hypothetical protein